MLSASDLRFLEPEAQDVHQQRSKHNSPANSKHLYERTKAAQLQEQANTKAKVILRHKF